MIQITKETLTYNQVRIGLLNYQSAVIQYLSRFKNRAIIVKSKL